MFLRAWYLLGPVIKFTDDELVNYEFAGVQLTACRSQHDSHGIEVVRSNGESLRSHITRTGLVFTSISDAAPGFDDFFPGLEDILETVDFTTRPYRRSIKYEGHFNWKTMVDGCKSTEEHDAYLRRRLIRHLNYRPRVLALPVHSSIVFSSLPADILLRD